MKVGIVGAGPSGICAAKIFHEQGFEITVLEKAESLGGVWSICYPSACLQSRYVEYEFSDYPHPKGTATNPSASDIVTYFNGYVKHFGVDQYMKFNSKVEKMEFDSTNSKWNVVVENQKTKKEEKYQFDFMIVAKGLYCDDAFIPEVIENEMKLPMEQRTFKGTIIHDREYTDENQIKDIDVAVIGFGKSATDISTRAAELSKSSTLIFRQSHWMIPHYFFGFVHSSEFFFARSGYYLLETWRETKVQKFIHNYLPFIPYLFWRFIELLICLTYLITPFNILFPKHGFDEDTGTGMDMSPVNFVDYVKKGKINAIQSEIGSFEENGIVLKNGKFVKTDLLVSSTGYKELNLHFMPQFHDVVKEDGLHLYRHTIHPSIPNLAFAGNNYGFLFLTGVEVSMYWLVSVLKGSIRLPSKESQLQEVRRIREWKSKNVEFDKSRGGTVGPRFFTYLDELFEDLGVSNRVKSNTFLHYFKSHVGADFTEVNGRISASLKNIRKSKQFNNEIIRSC